MHPVTGRFAPSPSGRMHLGNLLCALLSWLSARAQKGRFLLRIEDLDTGRCKQSYADQILDDLHWLGLDWDGEVLYQSRRTAVYEACQKKLEGMGLVYPCFCTRADLHAASAPHLSDGRVIYPGTCRSLSPTEICEKSRRARPALRLRVPQETIRFTDRHLGPCEEDLAAECGDFIIRRSDGLFAYQLAVVADDALTGVTEVVRGADLLSSSPRQIYLYRLLGYPPPLFCHFPLLCAPDGRRLSKRDRDLDVGLLRSRLSPQQVIGLLACAAGLQKTPAPVEAAALVPQFCWELVPKAPLFLPPFP